jgi:acetyl-CoA acetyltransferase family protein
VLAGERPDDLAALVIGEAVSRAGVPAGEIEDVYFGAANQAGEDNRNVARMAALLAGLPDSVAGVTVNRLCASGLSAVVGACHAVAAGDGDLFVAGGVESMSRAPLVLAKPETPFPRGNRTVWDTTLGWRFPNPRLEAMFPLESMGETGENVAERYGVSREEQDAFALQSQRRWAEADAEGRFEDELVAVGEAVRDEHPRPDTSEEKLAALKPGFREGGTVTAGNSSGINDGAAALVIASEERARELGVEPLGAFVGSAVAGVDPRIMGIGPMPITRGSTPATEEPTNAASGWAPSSRAQSSLAITSAAAPSLMPDELPAVTVPSARNAGFSAASFSALVSGRGCSSRTASPTGTSSSANRPAASASAQRCCDCSAKASCSSRETP